MSDKLREILLRLSENSGLDEYISEYDKSVEENRREVAETRASLPNRQAKRRFDKEMRREATKKKSYSEETSLRQRKKSFRLLKKLDARLKESGAPDCDIRVIPPHIWKTCQHVIADSSGWAAKHFSKKCPDKIGITIIHRAALSFDKNGEQEKYSYQGDSPGSIRARKILAHGLLFEMLARRTGRRGQGWNRIVKGIPQAAIQAVLRDPYSGHRPHINSINGTHRKCSSDETNGSVGYLTALKRVGFCYSRQARWKHGADPRKLKGWNDIQPNEMAGKPHNSGWVTSCARYWIVSDSFLDAKEGSKRAKLWVAWLAGQQSYTDIDDNGVAQPDKNSPESTVARAHSPPG
jgi:hypothetical protein